MGKRDVHVFHPVVVLSTLSGGTRTTRVIPELGQVPTLRWEPGREMLCFSMLLRAVLFGVCDVLAAKEAVLASKTKQQVDALRGIILNRLPGPVSLQRCCKNARRKRAAAVRSHTFITRAPAYR